MSVHWPYGFQAAGHHNAASNLKNTQYVTAGCIRFSSVFSKSILGSFSYFDVGYNKGLKLLKGNPSICTWNWILSCRAALWDCFGGRFYETETKMGLNSTPAPLKSPIMQSDTQAHPPQVIRLLPNHYEIPNLTLLCIFSRTCESLGKADSCMVVHNFRKGHKKCTPKTRENDTQIDRLKFWSLECCASSHDNFFHLLQPKISPNIKSTVFHQIYQIHIHAVLHVQNTVRIAWRIRVRSALAR